MIRVFNGYPPWSAATAIFMTISQLLLAHYPIYAKPQNFGHSVAILAGSVSRRNCLRIPISLTLIMALSCHAQQVTGPKSDLTQAPGGLKIVVVQGEGAKNNVRTRNATQPVVEVRDDSDKPVAGAEVVFQLPPAGPGGVFNGWMRTQTARTSPEGRAGAKGFAPHDEVGRFNI